MAKVYFGTFGCSVNFSESEIMKALLVKAEFELVDKIEDAFVVVLSICTVKGNGKALREIRLVREKYPYKKIVVAGCIPADMVSDIRKIVPDASLISTHNIKDIVSVVEETINDNPISVLTHKNKIKINMPKIRRNNVIGIVPISSGCLGECAYCSVKLIKGELFSYPMENIINEVMACLDDGCREIWVTSQDSGAYMMENGDGRLPELLDEIIKIDKDFLVRVGMMNPDNALKILPRLIEVFKSKKIFKFLHVPVQSGNNDVLLRMNRTYNVEEFKEVIKRFREVFPKITISTDIICGFPGETKEQFSDSLSLIKEIKPDVLNVSRFRLRKGTDAEKMEQLAGDVIKERSGLLSGVFDWIAYEQNKKWRNWEGNIIIDEKGKNGSFIGRNLAYKPVIVNGDFKVGDVVKVRVTDITKHDLRGVAR